MTVDWQQMLVWLIVGAAALAVGRRLWGQVAGFRRSGPSGGACDGCPSAQTSSANANNTKNAKTNPAPLIQLQTRPPLHLRRPPGD